jgi:hypothetical protein
METVTMGRGRWASWTRRQVGLAAAGALTTVLGLSRRQETAAKPGHSKQKRQGTAQHAQQSLSPVGDSGVSGFVTLQPPPSQSGPSIVVHATGLIPGTAYVSLYYDNDTFQLEPYSEEDVIGGEYVANPAGKGQTHGEADDDLEEIGSVSVRRASDFTLVACATL